MAALALARDTANDPTGPGGPLASAGATERLGLEDELAQLRQLIRMIGHEVGNSLGPLGSLLGTARVLVARRAEEEGDGATGRAPTDLLAVARLDSVLRTAAERAGHLRSFIEECVRMTRLPDPRPAPAEWGEIADRLRALWPGLSVELPSGRRQAAFDVSQIEQVLVNLLKNAYESGGPPAEVRVVVEVVSGGGADGRATGTRVTVLDRGRGASELELDAMSRSGFTTKRATGGVGLGVCRTLIGRHGGQLRIERRAGHGLAVSFWLPDSPPHLSPPEPA